MAGGVPGQAVGRRHLCRQGVRHLHDPRVQELGFVDGDHLGIGPDPFRDLERAAHRNGVELVAVVGAEPMDAAVPIIQLGLEDLDRSAGDQRSTHPAKELLRLSAEHDPADDLDPSVLSAMEHQRFSVSVWCQRIRRRLVVAGSVSSPGRAAAGGSAKRSSYRSSWGNHRARLDSLSSRMAFGGTTRSRAELNIRGVEESVAGRIAWRSAALSSNNASSRGPGDLTLPASVRLGEPGGTPGPEAKLVKRTSDVSRKATRHTT